SFVARPNLRGLDTDDWDERVADLQYRDVCEFSVGDGVATKTTRNSHDQCHEATTEWMPMADVERVERAQVKDVEVSMEALGAIGTAQEMRQRLAGLKSGYTSWIALQRQGLSLKGRRLEVAEELLKRAEFAARRIDDGINTLSDSTVFEAFQIAN